ncbi:MAG: hypothetical protein ACP6IS_01520 [Candidatus Asgardarchaeia archaeon]
MLENILRNQQIALFVKVFSLRKIIDENVTIENPPSVYELLKEITKRKEANQMLRFLAIAYLYNQKAIDEDEVLEYLKDDTLPWQFKEALIEFVVPRILRIFTLKRYILEEKIPIDLKMKIFLELFNLRKTCVDWAISFLNNTFSDTKAPPNIRYHAFMCLLKCEEDISLYKNKIFDKKENIVIRALLLEELDRLGHVSSVELLKIFREEEHEGLRLLALYRYLLKGLRIPLEELTYIYALLFDKTIDFKLRFLVVDILLKSKPEIIKDRLHEFIESIDDPYDRWDTILELYLIGEIDEKKFKNWSLEILSHPRRTYSLVQRIVNSLYRRGILTEEEYRAILPT